jgi:hypothetical protein
MCTLINFSPSFSTSSILRAYCTLQLDDQGFALILLRVLSLNRLETKVNRLGFIQDNRVTLKRMKKGSRVTSTQMNPTQGSS